MIIRVAAQAWLTKTDGMRRPVEGWQQERPDRCAQAGRVVTRQPTPSRVPRRAWGSHLEETGRSYLTITQDVTRVMNRIKALYRSWAFPALAQPSTLHIIAPSGWLRLRNQSSGTRPTALSATGFVATGAAGSATRATGREPQTFRRQVAAPDSFHRSDSLGLLVALLQTPHRFRTKRQLWAYSGFAVETHDSGEYRSVRGKLQRNRERMTVRGLNDNHNRELKNLFKSAAVSASTRPGPLRDFYVARVEKGMRPTMARLTLARKLAAISLTIWKKGVDFDAKQLDQQAA